MAAKVNDPSDAVKAMQPGWALANALLGGTFAMRKAAQVYLPKWPNEERDSYDARLATATLFPAFARTVVTLAAKPFSKAVTLSEDMSAEIKAMTEDIDQQGRNLHVFAAEVMKELMGPGLAGILVDYPPAEGVKTLADERSRGLRPYWVMVKADQILGWRAERVQGEWRLTQLRLLECVTEKDGDFGDVDVQQVRVLEPGKWAVYRKAKDKDQWDKFDEGATTLSVIPFIACYGERTGFMTAKPPLLELAHLNVKHWQSQSDQDTILHVARVPILAVVGAQNQMDKDGKPTPFKLTVGASAAVNLPKDGDLKYVEHTGAAIDAGKASLDDLKEEMRQAGAELLVLKPTTTATQVHSENAIGLCALQEITLSLQDSLNAALQLTADWIKKEQAGTVALFNDFGAATLDAATATLIKDMVAAGQLSKETGFKEQQRRGTISGELVWDDEKEKIEAQGPDLGLIPGGGVDVSSAVDQLNAAITLHKKHMNGTAPTTGAAGEASQKKMMDQMMAALSALNGGSMGSMKGMS